MVSLRLRRILIANLSAALLTAALGWGDLFLARRTHQETGLRLGRQVAAQAESLIYQAKELRDKDPIGWAVGRLSQGMEPRIIQLTRYKQIQGNHLDHSETFSLQSDHQTFEYTKTILTDLGLGVRILVNLGYTGFLGTVSPLASDLTLLLVYGISLLIAHLGLGAYFGFTTDGRLDSVLWNWIRKSKPHVVRLAGHLRELVRQAQRLAISSGRSRDAITQLKSGLAAGILYIDENQEIFEEAEEAAARAEGLSLSLAIEADRMRPEDSRISDLVTDLHACIAEMRECMRRAQSLVEGTQKNLEPCTNQVDEAFRAFDEVRDASLSLDIHITSTTTAIREHVQDLKTLEFEAMQVDPESQEAHQEDKSSVPLPEPLPPLEERKSA